MSFIGIFFLLAPIQLITARPYRYYHTKSQQPVRQNVRPRYTQNQIDNAWIKVPWTHGGHYWYNTLTREIKIIYHHIYLNRYDRILVNKFEHKL